MTKLYYALRHITHMAYPIKGIGLGRLCEAIRRWSARHAPASPLPISDFRGDASFHCYLREHMGGQIFFRGSYSGEQLSLLERLLGTSSVFVDAGANQGEFTIAAARITSQGKVIAIEPVAEYRARLRANVDLNCFDNVLIVPIALGEQPGTLPIFDQDEVFTDGTRHEGLPTLFRSELRHSPRETVQVRRLDDIIDEIGTTRIDVIKLDIEGAEWTALRGAANTLSRYRPVLILEIGRETCRAAGYEPEDLAHWLTGQGYRLERIMDGGTTSPVSTSRLDDFQNLVAYPNKGCL